MRKMKKLAALCLAMLMAFSIMAVIASAYDAADGHEHTSACSEQTIMPRRPVRECPKCRGTAYLQEEYYHGVLVTWYECSSCGWVDR